MIIGVDFDGTIVKHAYPHIGPAIPGALEVLQGMTKDKNITLILHTCREGQPLADAVAYCKENGVTFDFVNEGPIKNSSGGPIGLHKPVVDIYIDDRSVFWQMKCMADSRSDNTNLDKNIWGIIEQYVNVAVDDAESNKWRKQNDRVPEVPAK